LTVAGEDRNSQYLSSASAIGDRSAKARKIERIDAMIPEGTLIPGILETAIVSDLPGQVRAITSRDVYSFDGRRVLIPTGTRLIG
ncbi:TrbI/VirB10 family protein, partial [Rhizobium sp. FKY42]|uniref:TrbI/VirB10 family protein n=1 Tax=Rhizobium sp. FKY42 TaxID=2562310 RepID=UPI0024849B01